MKFIIFFSFLALSFTAEALFFKKTPKDGCNPNPCKNKAECVLDNTNPSATGTCSCKPGYYGKLCENKDGCLSKPCKAGECILNSANKALFTCKCPGGRLGDKCDKTDECFKNPCKNNGTCALDSNLKAVCSCLNGWTGKNCEKRNCTITQFKGKQFTKLPKVFIDKAAEPQFKLIDDVAKSCKVIVKVSRSFSVQQNSKIVAVSQKDAPHFSGRGITFELLDEKEGLLCNEICLNKKPIPSEPANCFIKGVVSKGLRWDSKNPTQIHDGSSLSSVYSTLRETAQVGCKEENF